jgi:hypothetical protein
LIRAAAPAFEDPEQDVPEQNRYFTAEADPSQKFAVFQARALPGLIVQGPPGTGKSQTIVNVVCDCLGRNERVLVVCQKPAALEVVQKRLEAEGLGNRFFYVRDAAGDRQKTLLDLRVQLENFAQRDPGSFKALEAKRAVLAKRIEALEDELNAHHEALHGVDARSGMAYKEILSRLLDLEKPPGAPVAAPRLRMELAESTPSAIETACDRISTIACDWLHSRWEESPFHVLKEFSPDSELVRSFWGDFEAYFAAEKERADALHELTRSVQTESPDRLRNWLAAHGAVLLETDQELAGQVHSWHSLFRSADSSGDKLLLELKGLEETLRRLDLAHHHEKWSGVFLLADESALRRLSSSGHSTRRVPVGLWDTLSPMRAIRQQIVYRFLKQHGSPPNREEAGRMAFACDLELSLRIVRESMEPVRKRLGISQEASHLPELRQQVAQLLKDLSRVKSFVELLLTCPVSESEIERLFSQREAASYQSWVDECRRTVRVLDASRHSRAQAEKLVAWFQEEWQTRAGEEIQANRTNLPELEKIMEHRESLGPFQRFRMQAGSLSSATLQVLSALRRQEGEWKQLGSQNLAGEMIRTIRREALLGWKDRYERAHPSVLMGEEDFDRKKAALQEADAKLRELNRAFLTQNIGGLIAPRRAWDEVTMLRGPRAKRLREVAELAEPLGLYSLRPVWLVNPDMVSRLFPLRAGFFDVVIFDEASQLPVEAALPALVRAKRALVSGDEKQMPPSSFFQSRLQNDEEEETETWREDEEVPVQDPALDPRLAKQNRREIKDCEDLLELAQNVLPDVTLKVHYRSRYRQLISFSNAAFYAGKLSVPAQHPESEIQRIKPIEVVRTNSVYANQTNPGEADKVVELLANLWAENPFDRRPSLGIVTFNLRQAELIGEKLEERAEEDAAFRRELELEYDRKPGGEDMSLFVKNLENVQGDERDWIIFSTTFGRDPSGAFLRNFGVLIQEGGEKRLNVAITRAREKIVLVTSMPVSEISNFVNGHRSPSKPRDYLQAYLDYAEKLSSGNLEAASSALKGLSHAQEIAGPAAIEPGLGVAAEVRSVLEQHGFELVALNASDADAFALDYAIMHPEKGVFCLGIECDSPRHGLLQEARGRELWRQRILASLFSRVYRVWTRSWYENPEREAGKLLEAVRNALR